MLCEVDPLARAVLAARFPSVRLESDVRELRVLPRGVDLLTAGFPCQDLSPAGTTKGIRGSKSSLVHHVFRLLRGRDVPWVLLENVPFMLHLQRGRAMRLVTDELEDLGYRWAYRVLDAMAFGLPQRRRRVFLLASRVADPADVLFGQDAGAPPDREWTAKRAAGFYWTEGNRGIGWAVDAVPTLKGGSGWGIPSPPAILLPDGRVVKPSIRDAERLQGLPADWTEPAIHAEGARASGRWKLVGNAVCVEVSKWVGEQLSAHLDRPSAVDTSLFGDEVEDGAWPDAACSQDGRAVAVRASAWPVRVPLQPIAKFLSEDGVPLSVRATSGFVERVVRAELAGKLRSMPGFLDALRGHVERIELEAAKAKRMKLVYA